MKILNSKYNLECYLKELDGKKISIVTAFASGTESIIKGLLDSNNEIELIVGSINSFSSPKFINEIKAEVSSKLSFFMDFRYERSTHWKLYLIDPNVVIIGSANFTQVGVSLERDTLVLIKNESLYHQYSLEINKLKQTKLVINSLNNNFEKQYKKYIEKHRKMQSSLLSASGESNVLTWLSEDANQSIPLFIWDRDIDPEEQKEAYSLIKDEEPTIESSKNFRLLTYECNKSELLYYEGDTVISISDKGSYAKFEKIDRIRHEKGINYLYSFKNKRISKPFDIKEISVGLKRIVPSLYEKKRTALYREDIEDAVK